MCCSTRCRSWSVSATRSTVGSWTSSPRSTATGCGVPGLVRSRRWWPGRPGVTAQGAKRSSPSRTGSRVPPLRGGDAGGPVLAGSGRGDRQAGSRGVRWALRAAGRVATVNQLRTAVKLEPPPEPEPDPETDDDADEAPPPRPEPPRSFTKTSDEQSTTYRITTAARRGRELRCRRGLAPRRADHRLETRPRPDAATRVSVQAPPFPTTVDAFMSLVEAGWDAEVARRPHGQHTTVVVHVDLESRVAALHLGPLLSDADRRYLTCDATCEVWFERDGQVIGAGRATRTDQPPAAPRAGAPRPLLCGARLRGDPRSARPPHNPLGGRRPHRTGQPGSGLPVTTTGPITAGSSPSPDPPSISSSPTASADP